MTSWWGEPTQTLVRREAAEVIEGVGAVVPMGDAASLAGVLETQHHAASEPARRRARRERMVELEARRLAGAWSQDESEADRVSTSSLVGLAS